MNRRRSVLFAGRNHFGRFLNAILPLARTENSKRSFVKIYQSQRSLTIPSRGSALMHEYS